MAPRLQLPKSLHYVYFFTSFKGTEPEAKNSSNFLLSSFNQTSTYCSNTFSSWSKYSDSSPSKRPFIGVITILRENPLTFFLPSHHPHRCQSHIFPRVLPEGTPGGLTITKFPIPELNPTLMCIVLFVLNLLLGLSLDPTGFDHRK